MLVTLIRLLLRILAYDKTAGRAYVVPKHVVDWLLHISAQPHPDPMTEERVWIKRCIPFVHLFGVVELSSSAFLRVCWHRLQVDHYSLVRCRQVVHIKLFLKLLDALTNGDRTLQLPAMAKLEFQGF